MSIDCDTKQMPHGDWVGERGYALGRLREFIPKVPRYAPRRNYAVPGDDGVSRLSPYLRYRLISEEEVVTQVTSALDFTVAEKFIQEVVWRTYWKGALHLNPGVWYSYKERVNELVTVAETSAWGPRYEAACAGQTHLSYFNEWVQELTATGYLHNHVRMWFASIWIFTLRIPWQLGAAFMYHHLLDGDPASNTLSWRWVAGLHTKGKTYIARADNIAKYSEGRWSPREDELAREAFVVQDEIRCSPDHEPALRFAHSSAAPGLILSTDDLSIEQILDTRHYSSVCIYDAEAEERTPLKRTFLTQAIEDLRERVSAQRDDSSVIVASSLSDLTRWREREALDSVAIIRPQIGPQRDHLDASISSLSATGASVGLLHRRWDCELFPLCSKGFFTMWEKFRKRWDRAVPLSGVIDAHIGTAG
jgi:deoxyribodipyrimidine photo-lyase